MPLIIATPSTIADSSQRRPELAAGEAFERDRDHVESVPITASTSAAVARMSSLTISPSAMKRIRSAIAAARGVVRHHHGRLPVGVHRLAHQLEDLTAGLRVEVAGRLVGEQDRGPRDEGARDRHPLLLAAGQLGRAVAAPALEADLPHELVYPRLVGLLAGDRERQGDVLLGVEHRQEVEELEDEANVLPAQPRQRCVAEGAQLGAGDRDRARGRLVETREQVHEGGLARPRWTHHSDELAGTHLEIDAAKRIHRGRALAVAARHRAGRQGGAEWRRLGWFFGCRHPPFKLQRRPESRRYQGDSQERRGPRARASSPDGE